MKRIYRFSADAVDGDASMAMLLGGKGANLAEMAHLKIPVPPGFTITTEVCKDFETVAEADKPAFMFHLMEEVAEHMAALEAKFGYMPLVSVRSGAPVSMPGMMDTILNVGMTNETAPEWAARLGNRAASDSMRRLIQMLGATGYGVPAEVFEFQLARTKKDAGVTADTDLTTLDLDLCINRYLEAFKANKGLDFPVTNAKEQLQVAIEAVFRSWMNPRAIEYRKINKIDPSMGTAVTVQAMVFGNMGDTSGTGVLFSRNAASGANEVLGEFLPNAQGEDVVAGIRTPLPLHQMQAFWPEQHSELMAITERLESNYQDMMDLEFTVQQGKLWLLQCRIGKRSAIAAVKIAVQLVEEGLITQEVALRRVTKEQFKILRRPRIPDSFKTPPHGVGLPASPGVASGIVVMSSEAAVNCKEPCVLVTHDTCPDDIAGMNAARGILTSTGGSTSHAAVVARGMDKPCVVGCTGMVIQDNKITIGQDLLFAGEKVTIDGATGRFWFGADVPVVDASDDPAVMTLSLWALRKAGHFLKASDPIPSLDVMQVFMLADIWGNDDAFVSLIGKLQSMGSLGAALDFRPPHELLVVADTNLADCFGVPLFKDAGWGLQKINWLLEHEGKNKSLYGLLLLNLPHVDGIGMAALREAGFQLCTSPETVSDLLKAQHVVLSEHFIQKVIGSDEAWGAILSMLHASGRTVRVARPAVPMEYAALMALA